MHEDRQGLRREPDRIRAVRGNGTTRTDDEQGLIESLLSMWPEPMWILDGDGRIVAAGDAVRRQLGWSPAALRGRHIAEALVDPADRDRLPPRVLGTGGGVIGAESRSEVRMRRRDGSAVVGEFLVGDLQGRDAVRRVAVLRPDREAQERELFEVIFRNAPDIISIIDRSRGQLLVNDAAERLLGHNLHRLEDNAGMVHPEDLPRVRVDLPPRADGFGGPVRYRAQTSRGDWRWLESTSSDLRDRRPVGGILVFTRDVTAEVRAGERLAASRARLFALVTGVHAGILVQDEDGQVVIANAALMEMFSLDGEPGGIEGSQAIDVMHSLSGAFTTPEDFLHAVRESVAARTPGVTRWPLSLGTTVELEAIPINGDAGSDMGYMWAFRDVTDRVAAEDHRRRMEEMERDARAALEEQNARLNQLDHMRTQMIATVSHEFRTPLTPIASHVELLLDPSGDPLSADQRESVEAIERNVTRLRRLVDDLLIVRRVEQGLLDIRPAPVDIASLVTAQAAQFAPYAKRVGVDLSCRVSPGPPALADADRLGTVIDNLIANALKFTPRGGRTEVTAEPRGDRWEIRVADTGPGIPQEELAHIFEPFFRSARALNEGLPGSGLGLTVSRALVEGHGGMISAQSSAGHGSTFTVVLPRGGPG